MKDNKILNIRGVVLEKNQLENYMEKIATDHVITKNSDKNTYPIPRVKENFEIISYTYQLLNEHVKQNIQIHPAGEWLLDNFYTIEEMYQVILKELSKRKYVNFQGLANGIYKGFARIYVLASEIVAYTDSKINSKNLSEFLQAYQNKKTLSMEEIWNISLFIQIALMENIRQICERIYVSQIQKYKVQNITQRLVEGQNKPKYKNLTDYKTKITNYEDMKYPFIEYMSYKLKKYGRAGYPFLNVLEEQVNKMGTSISDVIRKEHFDIATKKVSMGNAINSIKTLQRINFQEIFEKLNGVEDILKKDPLNVYDNMDYKTKEYYRNKIKQISKKTKVSEIYIANKVLELAGNGKNKKEKHVGYYLIDKGEELLLSNILGKKYKKYSNREKTKIYIATNWIISLLLTVFIVSCIDISVLMKFIIGLFILIPIQSLVIQIIQYILGKILKPKLIPKIDMSGGVPKEDLTCVVIPTILKEPNRVRELVKKLEVYYLANKSENMYFALLGDCSASSSKDEDFDDIIIETGKEEIEKLNKKYANENEPIFTFYYRKRTWNDSENSYIGWERKRGLLHQFNSLLLGEDKYIENFHTCPQNVENQILKTPKYVITLDADTNLILDSGLELIGAMAHILNKPILNEEKNCVIDGYGIMQPRVGIDLLSCRKSLFTELFAGNGGTDSYTNAIFDVYQDNFGEGIFAGKGIYDLKIFYDVMKDKIPENVVLSHDLLEGCYVRSALVTDVQLMDGYPIGYNSYKSRQHRWIRGDFQIARWLKGKVKDINGNIIKNPLNILSKYKILDNMIRALVEPLIIVSLGLLTIISLTYHVKIWSIVLVLIISTSISSIIEILNRIIWKKEGEEGKRTFIKTMPSLLASFSRGIIYIGLIPDKAYTNINACIKTWYRLNISKKHLLEWTTSEEAEKMSKKDIISYYKNMVPNIVCAFIAIIYAFLNKSITAIILGILWILMPVVLQILSKERKSENKFDTLTKQEKDYLYNIGRKTWEFFRDNINEKNHYLMPDNYQEDRKEKIVKRTSSTNLGLSLLAVISSYDLKYESYDKTINLLYKILISISNLPKWNGHLYNWYNIETCQMLSPKYVSTVDSGNFVGYLYVVKQFLEEAKEQTQEIIEMKNIVNKIIVETDFSKLYDYETRLFSIGFNVEDNKITDSYYDLLASEARQASLIAIAKKDISSKHWYNLSRTLTILNHYKGLISWSGTAFEYLMPNINISKYPGSLLDESCKFMIMSQKEYAKKLGIPWGISESAFNLRDFDNNYQYKAFGIPWLGLKRGLADEIVVTPYGSIMAVTEEPKNVIKNLKILENQEMLGKYGFYESIDYTPIRLKKNRRYEPVKTYMAHHQGLILASINNLFNSNIFQKRFKDNPEIEAVDILLQERMPEKIIITKEEKEKVEKIKYMDYENYSQREYSKIDERLNITNVISNQDYTVVMDQKGEGYSKYKNILINRYKETDEEVQGICFYLKNIKQKRIWTAGKVNYLSKPDKYNVIFAEDVDKFKRLDGNIETNTKITISPESNVEIRSIELKNIGTSEEMLEITSFFEPVLSTKEQDYSHKAFNNLFLMYEYLEDENAIIVKRKKRSEGDKEYYLYATLYTEGNTVGEFEFELDKERFYGRDNFEVPVMIKNSVPFSKKIGYVVDPIIAMKRTILLRAEETANVNLILAIGETKEEVMLLAKNYYNSNYIKRTFELSRAKVEAESIYLGLKGKEIETYQRILSYLIFQNQLKTLYIPNIEYAKYLQSDLWKYGISGDLPILLIRVKDETDAEVVREALKAYEFYRSKGIEIDLIILNEEKHKYENYVLEAIQNMILNYNLGYLQNINGGIHIIESIDDRDLLIYKANFVVNAKLGGMKENLEELEEEYLKKYTNIPNEPKRDIVIQEEEIINSNLNYNELNYYNEYGGFSADGKEYKIRVNKREKLPTVWSHIMANKNFGTLVTESLGGFTWYKNSRLNRITAWSNNQVTDIPSEIIYMKDVENLKVWSLGLNPMPNEQDYYITYGFRICKI